VGIFYGLFKKIFFLNSNYLEFTVSQIIYVICFRRAVGTIVKNLSGHDS